MVEGLDGLLEGNGQPGLTELRNLLQELLGAREAVGRLIDQHGLQSRVPRVYRLRFEINGRVRSLVVKRLDPGIARRNQLVTERWLPAVGLSQGGPPLLGSAAERSGQCVCGPRAVRLHAALGAAHGTGGFGDVQLLPVTREERFALTDR